MWIKNYVISKKFIILRLFVSFVHMYKKYNMFVCFLTIHNLKQNINVL